ncbi:MAG: glycosyltransferase [bacterium]|nr:glycosyltransferase [bacterium]
MNRENKFLIKSPVYLDCRHFDGSGIGTYIGNLLRHYSQLDEHYPIEILARSEHIPGIQAFSKFNVRPYNDPIYSVREQFKWVSKIDPFGLLHVPHYNAPLIYPGQLITTVHDVCHVAMRQFFPGFLKRVYSRDFLHLVLRKADFVITVSEFSKAEIIKYFNIPEDKIRVIYNGVDPIFRPLIGEEAQAVLRRHGLPQEYLLFIGNVKPHKNISGLVTSYKMALADQPDLPPLVILGQYKNLLTGIPGLAEQVSDPRLRNKIIFTGYLPTEDLPAIYSQAMLFLFPSFYEGFGLPTLEAMACGTPVITSNCASIPEVVGDSALLVDPYNHEMMSQSILDLAGDSQLQLSYRKKGLEHVKKFNWEHSAREHLEIYAQAQAQARAHKLPAKYQDRRPRPENRGNILFLDQYGDRIGGGQVILLDILERFRASNNWDIHISVPNEGSFTRKLEEAGFNYWCVPTWQPSPHKGLVSELSRYLFSSVKSTYLLSKKIRRYNIDAIYCNGGRTFLSGSLLSLLFPLKVFWHLHLILDRQQKRVVTFFGRLPSVKVILAVSKTLESQYKNDSIAPKLRTVANWVSPQLFATPRIQRKAQLELPMRIGVVGLICRAKGQWTILEALNACPEILPIQLKIYGEPLVTEAKDWNDFEGQMGQLKQKGWDVGYAGFENNTLKIYDNLDILVVPSIVPEAFGLTAIEAMAREVLVISNRSGALSEIIQHRSNGFLYQADRYSELPQLLKDLGTGKYEIPAIREAGLRTVEDLYHPEVQLNKLHDLIRNEVEVTP